MDLDFAQNIENVCRVRRAVHTLTYTCLSTSFFMRVNFWKIILPVGFACIVLIRHAFKRTENCRRLSVTAIQASVKNTVLLNEKDKKLSYRLETGRQQCISL